MKFSNRQRGLSLIEALTVTVLVAMFALVTTPPLLEVLRNSRLRAAARHVAGEVRYARTRSVGTGWEFRVAGVSAGSSGDRSNHYRIMARQSGAVNWPAVTTGPVESATLLVGEWIDLDAIYPGVEINPTASDEFALTFDPRGTPAELTLNFNPLQITGHEGSEKWLTISAAGSVQVN